MKNIIKVDFNSTVPAYKQIIACIEGGIRSGQIREGDLLPSLNGLADDLDISKETVKKAYVILRDKGIIHASQGKGYYVFPESGNHRRKILLLFDRLSFSKQVIYRSFTQTIGDTADVNIFVHNQDIALLEYYINEYLDDYDYFVIAPHFPLADEVQRRVAKCIRRIPNRKLILLDRLPDNIPGNFGAVYQDFLNDVKSGLAAGLDKLKHCGCLDILIEKSSLYHPHICEGVKNFCEEHALPYRFFTDILPEVLRPGDVYLIVNGQLDLGLVQLVQAARSSGLKAGREFWIISYNESPIDVVILDGLTTISCDFEKMGRLAAEMILDNNFSKIHCDFKMTRRASF